MRQLSIITLLLLSGCFLSARGRIRLPIRTKVSIRAEAHATVVSAPPAPVALQNAPVPEFFGVPLDNVQDVVFVLDVSGSMNEAATGAVASLATQPAPTPAPATGFADPNAPGGVTVGPAPGDPNDPSNTTPATDPNAPPAAAPTTPPPATVTASTASAPSTAPTKLQVAASELVDALQRLPLGTRMNVVFFDSGVGGYAPSMVSLDEAGRTSVITFVRGASAGGSTALAPAMRIAMLMNPHRIVLLSDGLGNVGGDADDVIRDAREAMQGGLRIDTVGLGSGQDARLMGTLANESGGVYQAL